jgi:hypothetical protein
MATTLPTATVTASGTVTRSLAASAQDLVKVYGRGDAAPWTAPPSTSTAARSSR